MIHQALPALPTWLLLATRSFENKRGGIPTHICSPRLWQSLCWKSRFEGPRTQPQRLSIIQESCSQPEESPCEPHVASASMLRLVLQIGKHIVTKKTDLLPAILKAYKVMRRDILYAAAAGNTQQIDRGGSYRINHCDCPTALCLKQLNMKQFIANVSCGSLVV